MRSSLWVLVLLLVHGTLGASELGRLFLSPAQRAAIDAVRHPSNTALVAAPAPGEAGAPTDASSAVTAVPETVTVNGYVARSAGAPTVWVNGRDGAPGKLSAPARDGQRVRVPLANGAGQIALKPGQSFDSESQQVSDAYEQRPQSAP
jgi:hypothetical protein